jgi:hypothetical protein
LPRFFVPLLLHDGLQRCMMTRRAGLHRIKRP